VPAPLAERLLRRTGRGQHGQCGSFLRPVGQDEVVQFLADALPPPRRPDQQVDEGEGAPRPFGGDVLGQPGGQLTPPGGRRAQRHPGRVADQVTTGTGLGQHESRLAALDPEPLREPRRVTGLPVGRVGVDLGVQRLQFTGVRGGLLPVEQLEGQLGHDVHSGMLGQQQLRRSVPAPRPSVRRTGASVPSRNQPKDRW
jgi:hypothetical protein